MTRPVAVVGFAFRLPGGSDEGLWASLIAGRDLVSEVPDDRWSKDVFFHPDRSEAGRSYTFAAGTLGDISGFDAGFFGISPREAMQMDPQQRMLLEMTWEAFESGGIPPSALRGSRTAVYVGYSGSDYSYRRADDLSAIDASSMTGNTGSVAANRISYWFDLRGPSMAVDTACSSSLVAFHQAWQAIQLDEADQAVVAGVSLHLHPMPFVGFSKASMLSPHGRCRVFDADADGYVRSEGGGVFLLKDLEAAENDGDQIFAVVAGVGSNCDGFTSGITIPSRDAQAELLRDVYERAGIAADEIDYFEAHGTGTAVGDPIETSSIATVLGKARRPDHPLPIGSVKSNLGHLETASGVAGLVKALYCLRYREVPASLHVGTPNPNIPLDEWNLEIVTENRSLPATGTLTIGVNSFGFGGANAHVVLRSHEAARDVPAETRMEQPMPALLLSASARPALEALAGRYARLLAAQPEIDLYALAFNAFRNREHLPQRLLLPANDHAALLNALQAFSRGEVLGGAVEGDVQVESSAPVFVYSGNGSQWAGMGQVLLEHDATFRAEVERVDALLQAIGADSVLEDIAGSPADSRYEMTEVAQPALFAIQVGITAVLRRHGIEPAASIGHSVGEVAAAWASGALTLEQAVRVIHVRSQAQGDTRGSGAMTAVALSESDMVDFLSDLGLTERIALAGINSPRGVTVAGPPEALRLLEDRLEEREVFHRRLPVDYAFHSPAMSAIEGRIKDDLVDLVPRSGGLFVSTVTGDVLAGSALDADYWWRNIREPVRFEAGIRVLADRGFNLFVEVGPHPVLRNYVVDSVNDQGIDCRVVETLVRNDERPSRLDETVGKVLLAAPQTVWSRYFTRSAPFVDLPHYPWQHESFWPSPTSESDDNLHRVFDHPLLGWREPDDRLVWEGRLDLRMQPELADHRVGDSVLFPAAGFVELALAAANLRDPGAAHVVEDLEIFAPLMLEPDTTRRVRFVADAGDGRFEISSNARLSDQPWMAHASGRLITGPVRAVDAEALLLPDRPYDFSAIDHYQLTEAIGLRYGPEFRTIQGVWRDGSVLTAAFRRPDESGAERYRLLPAWLDGCFQVLADHDAEQISHGDIDAHIPIRIDMVTTLREGAVPRYVKGRLIQRSERSALVDFDLYDDDRAPIAHLRGVRFKRIELVREVSNRHWLGYRLLPKPRVTADQAASLPSAAVLFAEVSPAVSEDATYHNEFLPLLDVLCAAYTERAVRLLGDDLTLLSERALLAQGRLVPAQVPLYERLVERLTDAESLEETTDGTRWVADAGLPDPELIWQRLLHDYPDHAAETLLVGRAGRCLPEVLSGALDGNALAQEWIQGAAWLGYLRGSAMTLKIERGLRSLLDRFLQAVAGQGRPLRLMLVLDRQTGLTEGLLRHLDPTCYEVTIVRDVTRSPDAVDALLETEPSVDVVELAFDEVPEQWSLGDVIAQDLVILDHVLSRLPDNEAALRVWRSCLRIDGQMLLADRPPTPWVDFVFGVAPDWWSAGFHPRLPLGGYSATDMAETLIAAGFVEPELIEVSPGSGESAPFVLVARSAEPGLMESAGRHASHTCVVIQDAGGFSAEFAMAIREGLQGRGCRVIPVIQGQPDEGASSIFHVDTRHPDAWTRLFDRLAATAVIPDTLLWLVGIEPDLLRDPDIAAWNKAQAVRCADIGALFDALAKTDFKPACWLATSGAFVAETPAQTDTTLIAPSADALVWGFGRCLANEYPGLPIRLVDLAAPHRFTAMTQGLVEELLDPPSDDEIVLGEHGRQVGRVALIDRERATQAFKQQDYSVALNFDTPGVLTGLRWEAWVPQQPKTGEVAIDVKAAGLNFRDVMYALGLLSDEAVEAGFAGATLGMELAGIIAAVGDGVTEFAVGDSVIAFAPASFSSRAITSASAVIAKPSTWSFAAAATVPTTFFTVFYAFQELARLQPGERVLIHGAAGGVGIAAIQLAHHIGAEVYATAGSPDKRDFVRQLGVEHVFDSRSLDFADEILAQTDGEGVDVVLNSLAGEAIARNLKVLRPFGRFLELGKRDFYENTRIGLRPFRNNISYFGIDADQLMAERPELTGRLFRALFELFHAGVLSPLPFTRFAAVDAVDAFRFMQQSKQVGKIVLDFDELPRPQVSRLPKSDALALSADATYLVTGGTGGFGAETARWLVARGARHLVLVSRRGTETPGVSDLVAELEAAGAVVLVASSDVTSRSDVESVLSDIKDDMPPLRGVIHAAMVIDDGLVSDLDATRIERVLAPKVVGALHLDEFTRGIPLDFFVVYSSATTTFGNPGQSSYVAANRFLEHLVERRRADGLAGLAVCWGPLEDAGYLARNEAVGDALASRLGGRALSVKQALDALGTLLRDDCSGIAVLNFDWGRLRRSLPASNSARFTALEALVHGDDDLGEVDEIRDLLLKMPHDEATIVLVRLISVDVCQILRLDPDKIDVRRSVHEFGMDSLMAMELAIAVEKRLNVQLPMMLLGEGPSIKQVAERILALMHHQVGQDGTSGGMEETVQMVAERHGHATDDQAVIADVVKRVSSHLQGAN